MVPLFCHIYLYWGIAASSLALQPAENVANLWDFKAFEASGTATSGSSFPSVTGGEDHTYPGPAEAD